MTSPRTLLKAWNLKARKQWGQNFLSDPAVAEAIVRRAGLSDQDVVVEIGAGLGALTLPMARAVRRIYAIEKDTRLAGLLKTELAAADIGNVDILQNDVLRVDLDAFPFEGESGLTAVGNLPYNISTQVIVRLIEHRHRFKRAVFMFQKELAERLAAGPGGKDYGRISVLLQYCARVSRLMEVDASRFFPKPRVDSTVLDIVFREGRGLDAAQEKLLFDVVRCAFSKRRKTLKNALSGFQSSEGALDVLSALAAAGIDPLRRAETLSVEDYIRLSLRLSGTDRGGAWAPDGPE
ncbi:MAG: 16S rRNA (adenine(1518)-N(6)/adenine(1519)-N(6))-dimethyltransferase RsmA [Desulfobacterales bacterium]